MDRLTYYFFRFFIILFRLIPFRLLFGLADLVFFVIYYLAGYRKQVVFQNLRNSFPEKPETEITAIAKGFYHHLSDMLIESLKAFTMSEEAVVRRYKYYNTEILDELYCRPLWQLGVGRASFGAAVITQTGWFL